MDLRAHLHLDLPVGFMAYFESRFPCLLMRCVEIACRFLSAERTFAPFCRVIAPLFQQNRSPIAAATATAETVATVATAPVGDQQQTTLLPVPDAVATLSAVVTLTNSSAVTANASLSSSLPTATADLAMETHTFSFPTTTVSATVEQHGDGHIANIAERDQIQPQVQLPQQSTLSEDVVVWQGSALAQSLRCRGWSRLDLSNPNDHWIDPGCSTAVSIKPRTQHQHLVRASTDFKYRSRLCTHWELTGGSGCPMRKKGKCDFGE